MKSKSVLDSFGTLRQGPEKLQINSSIEILNHFRLKQQESSTEGCKELQLGVARVIRGLGAPRSNARKGFFVTLVGLTKMFSSSTVTLQMCFHAIDKELQSFTSKGEEGDVYKGQILAYGALIHSGKILEATHEELQKIIHQMIIISTKKSYLKLAVHTFLTDLIGKVDENTFKKSLWIVIKNEIILKDKLRDSLHFYHLLQVMNKRFPQTVNSEFLTDVIGSPYIFHKNSIDTVGKLLLGIPYISYIDSPMYQQMVIGLVSDKKLLKKFWIVVDDYLSSASPLKMIHGFKLFIWSVQAIEDKNLIKHLLTSNFVRLLETYSELDYVEEARLDTINKFAEILSEKGLLNSKTQEDIVSKLLFYPGNFDFLIGPGIKIFYALVNTFDEVTVKSVTKLFTDVLTDQSMKVVGQHSENEPLKRPWKEGQKKKASNTIIRLINHPAVNSCVGWKINQMKIIIDIAFFSRSVSPKLCNAAQRCFYVALDHKFVRLTDLRSFLSGLVVYLDDKICSSNYLSVEINNQWRKAWKNMVEVVNTIGNEQSNGNNGKLTSTVFHVMFLLLGLTLFKEPQATIENLQELNVVYERMNKDIKTPNKSNSNESAEPHWTEVVVDLLLSLLSNNYHFHRNVISKIFIYLCPHLSSQNIHQILKVLNPNVNNIMATAGNDSDDDFNNSSIKFKKVKHKKDKDHDTDNSESDNDDNSDGESAEETESEMSGDDVDEDTECDKLRATIRDALGNAGAVTDTESIDLDDMDEEEGKRLDESLSEAFKQMKQQKLKAQSTEEKQLSDFRARVLDLLEIWMRAEPELNLFFDVMVTVLMLLENSVREGTDVQLHAKIRVFLKKLTSLKKFSYNEKLDISQIVKVMEKLMDKDDKTASVYINMTPQIIDCCTFILKISLRKLKNIKKMRPLILEAYKKALHNFFTKNNSVIPVGLFQTALSLQWEGAFSLVVDIVDYAFSSDIRAFHQGHALHLLQIFFKNKRLLIPDICKKYSNEIQLITSKIIENMHLLQDKPDKIYQQFNQLCLSIKKSGVSTDVNEKFSMEFLKQNVNKRKLDDANTAESNKKKKQKHEDQKENIGVESNNIVRKHTQHDDKENKPDKVGKKRNKYKEVLKLKKKSKLARLEKSSKGIEGGLFGSHLFKNPAFIHGEIQNEESDESN
ncbi:MYB binding protein 1a [Lycorma delicatula]|uniref:MYB binding protein 1a n=1 Tax=Lycorma delicatula TaxID=130591 RepID=UPI003F51030D